MFSKVSLFIWLQSSPSSFVLSSPNNRKSSIMIIASFVNKLLICFISSSRGQSFAERAVSQWLQCPSRKKIHLSSMVGNKVSKTILLSPSIKLILLPVYLLLVLLYNVSLNSIVYTLLKYCSTEKIVSPL